MTFVIFVFTRQANHKRKANYWGIKSALKKSKCFQAGGILYVGLRMSFEKKTLQLVERETQDILADCLPKNPKEGAKFAGTVCANIEKSLKVKLAN